MKPYCQDLRKRVVAKAIAGQQTQALIAASFHVSLSTVEKWLRRKRETGKTTPRPQAHGPKRALLGYAALVRAEVKKQPDLTLSELCVRVASRTGVEVSPSTLCRELQHLRLPRKKSRFTTASGTLPASAASGVCFGSRSPRHGVPGSDT